MESYIYFISLNKTWFKSRLVQLHSKYFFYLCLIPWDHTWTWKKCMSSKAWYSKQTSFSHKTITVTAGYNMFRKERWNVVTSQTAHLLCERHGSREEGGPQSLSSGHDQVIWFSDNFTGTILTPKFLLGNTKYYAVYDHWFMLLPYKYFCHSGGKALKWTVWTQDPQHSEPTLECVNKGLDITC